MSLSLADLGQLLFQVQQQQELSPLQRMKRDVDLYRMPGGRADAQSPPSPDAQAPSYGIRPAIMDPHLPDFWRYQPNSIE